MWTPRTGWDWEECAASLTRHGYRRTGKHTFTRKAEAHWTHWIALVDYGPGRADLRMGTFNRWTLDATFHASQAYATKHNVVRRIRSPVFLADLQRIVLSGTSSAGTERTSRPETLESATNATQLAMCFLDDANNYERCLENLERFSKYFPMYVSSRLVLLKALGRENDYAATAKAFLDDEQHSQLHAMKTLFVHRLSEVAPPKGTNG